LCVLPENPAALAQAILSMRDNPMRCERLVRNGRAWVKKYHSAETATEQFELLFLNAIEDSKR